MTRDGWDDGLGSIRGRDGKAFALSVCGFV